MGSMKILSALLIIPAILALSESDDIKKSAAWPSLSGMLPSWNAPAAAAADAAKAAEIDAGFKRAAADRATAAAIASENENATARAAEAAARAAAFSGGYARRSYSYSGFQMNLYI